MEPIKVKAAAIAFCAAMGAVSAQAKDCKALGGTANIRGIEEGKWIVAMTGEFDGGAFARVTGEPKQDGEWLEYPLQHFFTNDNGDWFNTRDVSRHTAAFEDRHYAQTTYNVVDSGGAFAGYRGSFRSWGTLDYATGFGVLRFEGEVCR